MSGRICPACDRILEAGLDQELCADCLLEAGMESAKPSAIAQTLDSEFVRSDISGDELSIDELNARLPNLHVEKLLGRGGMGAVYQARQKSLDRLVALKIINKDLLANASLVERFEREAKALAKLSHPHIVGVHDYGRIDDVCYLVMEFVDGTDLRKVLATKQVRSDQALQIVPQICDALQYAHDQGIVHRDIKPENILINQRGQVKIADFGLAKLLSESENQENLTTTRQVMGTLKYMAPEQMEGSAQIDHRADIYSLGVVFYELLTGEVPLGRFAAPSEKAQVDNRLDDIVLRALEKDLPDRYQQASDLQHDVQEVSSASYSRTPLQNLSEPAPEDLRGPDAYAATHFANHAENHSAAYEHEEIPTAQILPEVSVEDRIKRVTTHVRVIAALNIFFGILFLIVGFGVFLFLSSIGVAAGEAEAITVLASVGGIAAFIMLILGLPGVIIGFGLWHFRNWARFGALVFAVLNLANFPLGTLLSVYTGWALLQNDAALVFDPNAKVNQPEYR